MNKTYEIPSIHGLTVTAGPDGVRLKQNGQEVSVDFSQWIAVRKFIQQHYDVAPTDGPGYWEAE